VERDVAAPAGAPDERGHPALHPARHLEPGDERLCERARILHAGPAYVERRRRVRRGLGPTLELHPCVARLEAAAPKPRRELRRLALRRHRDHVSRLAEHLVGEVEHRRRGGHADAEADDAVQHERRRVAGHDARRRSSQVEHGDPVLLGQRGGDGAVDVGPRLGLDELEQSRVHHRRRRPYSCFSAPM
jgi:hypothetical protein